MEGKMTDQLLEDNFNAKEGDVHARNDKYTQNLPVSRVRGRPAHPTTVPE